MDLNKLILDSFKGRIQVVTFDEHGIVTSSDEGLASILGTAKNVFMEPILFGLSEALNELELEEGIELKSVEGELFNRLSIYDIQIKLFAVKVESKVFSLVIHDLKDHYKTVEELRQERNNAEIQTQELRRTHAKLNEVLQREIDGKKRLQETQTELVQSEKMASLGQLTSGMAHEINNPLNFIHNGTDLLREKLDFLAKEDRLSSDKIIQEAHNFLDIIKIGSERISEVVKGLQLFTGKNDTVFVSSDLHSNLNATVSLISYDLSSNIKIMKKYSQSNSVISCIPKKLNQAILNILKNSIQSIPDEKEGTIVISTNEEPQFVRISIKDNGTGIDDEDKLKIFNPFFTTRPEGKGKGLGLSISYSIIEDHGGSISFNSEKNSGSEFIISLPLNLN
ncbi:MAG: sensor histidine kinase [Ekhidna sp.]